LSLDDLPTIPRRRKRRIELDVVYQVIFWGDNIISHVNSLQLRHRKEVPDGNLGHTCYGKSQSFCGCVHSIATLFPLAENAGSGININHVPLKRDRIDTPCAAGLSHRPKFLSFYTRWQDGI
jgi:hypothetical protein